jgi:pyruvate ferredoxin oxidoreductase gamma subunit
MPLFAIERGLDLNMELCWHGRGGQGVVTANEILAETAIREGKYVKAFPEFGPERMGAPIRAFTRISSDLIRVHSQVYEPDIVIVLDPTLVGKVKSITAGLKKGSVVLANYSGSSKELSEALGTDVKCYAVDATKISTEEIGKPMANTSMLGALVKVSPIVSFGSLEDQMTSKFTGKLPDKIIIKNLSALKRAYAEVK